MEPNQEGVNKSEAAEEVKEADLPEFDYDKFTLMHNLIYPDSLS